MTGKIWFVGAGPGDPDLMTVKARKLLEQSGAVLFAGSLVDQAATLYAPDGCEIRDSKDMTLDEMTAWLLDQASRHATVIRLQTGDPGLYGALIEMTRPLTAAGVDWAVVPGVSSAMAVTRPVYSLCSVGRSAFGKAAWPMTTIASSAAITGLMSQSNDTPQTLNQSYQKSPACQANLR